MQNQEGEKPISYLTSLNAFSGVIRSEMHDFDYQLYNKSGKCERTTGVENGSEYIRKRIENKTG